MSETKWTKQDWLIDIDRETVYALNAEGTNRFSARVEGGWTTHGRTRTEMQEREANARLIAAAPELYQALENMRSLWSSVCTSHDWDPEHHPFYEQSLAILAKARGES